LVRKSTIGAQILHLISLSSHGKVERGPVCGQYSPGKTTKPPHAAKENAMARKPTRANPSVLAQLCNLIPAFLVPKVARECGVDKKARTFTPWSHRRLADES
jgi:hypothetical protein